MIRLVLLDTNVLLYGVDDKDLTKRDSARRWIATCWEKRCGRISTQVLNEFYNNACKKFPTAISRGDARAEIRRYQHWKPWVIDHPTVETAWAIESRYGLSWWDSLIVASAAQQGCDAVVTEDLQHLQQIDSVQILNPFIVGPEVLDATP